MFLQDAIFLQSLSKIGRKGSESAKTLKASCMQRFQNYKNTKKNSLGFWFELSQQNAPDDLFLSPCLQAATEVLWNDIVKKLVRFSKHQVPALSTNVQKPIIQILSPKNRILKEHEQVCLFYEDVLVGRVFVATISEKLLNYVSKGCKKLRSVTGHRIIRYLVQKGFSQFAHGHPDFRVIQLDRGVIEIAEHLKLSLKYISDITEVLHALAYLEFPTSSFRGNLIQISKYTEVVSVDWTEMKQNLAIKSALNF